MPYKRQLDTIRKCTMKNREQKGILVKKILFFLNNPNELDDLTKKEDLQDTEISPDADTGNDPIKLSTPITIPPVFQSP